MQSCRFHMHICLFTFWPAAILAGKLPLEIGIQQWKRSFERWLKVPCLSSFRSLCRRGKFYHPRHQGHLFLQTRPPAYPILESRGLQVIFYLKVNILGTRLLFLELFLSSRYDFSRAMIWLVRLGSYSNLTLNILKCWNNFITCRGTRK